MALLLALSWPSCAIFKRPAEVYVPVEMVVVQRLANGNWEVTPGLIHGYAKALARIKILEARIRELEKK